MKYVFREDQEGTAAKLKYARVHLDSLKAYDKRGSGDHFERAHVESFLYHLIGARDAFLQEINIACACGLEMKAVSARNLRTQFSRTGIGSPALLELRRIEEDSGSWLNLATEMRNHSTHRSSVPRQFNIGSEKGFSIYLKDPPHGRSH